MSSLLEHQFKTAKIKLHAELTPGISAILGNPGRLQQVFLNLFLNAKDAMPGGGTLNVATGTPIVSPGGSASGTKASRRR